MSRTHLVRNHIDNALTEKELSKDSLSNRKCVIDEATEGHGERKALMDLMAFEQGF